LTFVERAIISSPARADELSMTTATIDSGWYPHAEEAMTWVALPWGGARFLLHGGGEQLAGLETLIVVEPRASFALVIVVNSSAAYLVIREVLQHALREFLGIEAPSLPKAGETDQRVTDFVGVYANGTREVQIRAVRRGLIAEVRRVRPGMKTRTLGTSPLWAVQGDTFAAPGSFCVFTRRQPESAVVGLNAMLRYLPRIDALESGSEAA